MKVLFMLIGIGAMIGLLYALKLIMLDIISYIKDKIKKDKIKKNDKTRFKNRLL